MRPPGNSRDVLLTDLAEVISLWVAAQVIIELVDENRGQHAGVVGQGQAGWQIWNLPYHCQDLPEACRTGGSGKCKTLLGSVPTNICAPPLSLVLSPVSLQPAFREHMAYPE